MTGQSGIHLLFWISSQVNTFSSDVPNYDKRVHGNQANKFTFQSKYFYLYFQNHIVLVGSSFRIEEKSTAIYQHVKHVKLDPGLAEFLKSF